MMVWTRNRGARNKAIAVVAVLCLAPAAYGFWYAGQVLSIGAAFYAKTLCSGVLLADRSQDDVVYQDVFADMSFGIRLFRGKIDRDRGLVSVTLFGLGERQALFRPGLGCTLVRDTSVEALIEQARGFKPPAPAPRSSALWPKGARIDPLAADSGVDGKILKAAVNGAFDEPDPYKLRRTRSVVVVYRGRIVAERYGLSTGPDTRQPGWSLGKTILNALAGTLTAEGRLRSGQDQLFEQWLGEGDPRAKISVDNLLRMVSGLDFDEPHEGNLSDVRNMLYLTGDSVAYAASEEMTSPAGSLWFYASGSMILLSGVMRKAIGGGLTDYFSYPRKALFGPLGMDSAVIEPDAAGTFLAPAFAYASARDWARFGLLYLNDGVWGGKRILPEGWVKNSLRPTHLSDRLYGAGVWLKIPNYRRRKPASDLKLPEDAYYMIGHEGQMIAIIPSRRLVVVRMGLSRRIHAWDHGAFLSNLLKAFPKEGG